jgi:hypothetical protein
MSQPTIPVRTRFGQFLLIHAQVLWWTIEYIIVRRRWDLAPLILFIVLFGLAIFATTNPTVSVFLYPLF